MDTNARIDYIRQRLLEIEKENNILDDNTLNKWDSVRNLRNQSSHPNEYMLLPAEMIIQYVNNFAKEINKLFQTLP